MKVGDLVKIKDGTDDPDLPTNRIGIIVEDAGYNIPKILFSNGKILSFHEDYLIIISKKNIEEPND